jgi:hypothetical protein
MYTFIKPSPSLSVPAIDQMVGCCYKAPMSMTEKARKYVKSLRGEWPRLCAETGLSYHWVCKFAQGVIKNPSAAFVEKLQKHEKRT